MVVAVPRRGHTRGRCEHVVVGLQETIQEGWLSTLVGVEVTRQEVVRVRPGHGRAADARPDHAAAAEGDRQPERVEVPENGSQGAQPGDPKDHVVALEGDGVAVHLEGLVVDADADVAGDALALDAVAIRHDHVGAATVMEWNGRPLSRRRADEVMC